MSDACVEATWRELGKCCDLHRRDGRVTGDGRHDADADPDRFGGCEGRRSQAYTGGVEAVLDNPELVVASLLGRPGLLDYLSRVVFAVEAGSNGHRSAGVRGGKASHRISKRWAGGAMLALV